VFTARYILSPYIKRMRSVFKGLITKPYLGDPIKENMMDGECDTNREQKCVRGIGGETLRKETAQKTWA
jgi:hypothetical protein